MTVEGVVLYIGGGEAQHSAEMLRMQNFFHFRGQEGWLTASSGIASELPTPGTGLRISPGPFLINSRFPGGASQSYMGRVITGTDVPTTNVPPGSPRSDLVVMNIEDPYPTDGGSWPFPGGPGSDSRRTGPYAKIRVIDGVPDNTLSLADLPSSRPEREWTAIPICRLDRPQNTGTVSNDMVIPLRSVINPWSGVQLPQEILNQLDQIEDAVSDIGDSLDGILKQKFPVPAIYTNAGLISTQNLPGNTAYVTDRDWKTWPIEWVSKYIVPPWCTYVTIDLDLISVLFQTGSAAAGVDSNVFFGLRYVMGNSISSIGYYELLEPNDVYYSACPDKRPNRPPQYTNIKFGANMYVTKQDIGKKVTGALQVKMFDGNPARLYNGILKIIPGVSTTASVVNFKERPN